MALENFRIMVGGGPDPLSALAAQRQLYDQLNLSTAISDENRRMAAEQAANNWYSEAARIREAAEARAIAERQNARNLQFGLAVENARNWQAEQAARQNAALQYAHLAQAREATQQNVDYRNLQEARERDTMRRFGEFTQKQHDAANASYQAAFKAYTNKAAEASKLPETLAADIPPGFWDERLQAFAFPPKTSRTLMADAALVAKINNANAKLRAAQTELDRLKMEAQEAFSRLQQYQKANSMGLTSGLDNGTVVYHNPYSGETYGSPLSAPPPPPPPPPRRATAVAPAARPRVAVPIPPIPAPTTQFSVDEFDLQAL